ncbi:MAG: hypothetical protein WCD70_04660 [Alphaproteobacteria bacterium]
MTDWCTTDWNSLLVAFSGAEWRVHAAIDKDLWDYASIILAGFAAVITTVISGLAFMITRQQKDIMKHDIKLKIYEKYDLLYEKIRDGLLFLGTTHKALYALDRFRAARDQVAIYQYGDDMLKYCDELIQAAINADHWTNIVHIHPPFENLTPEQQDKITEAAGKLSEIQTQYTISHALDFFSKHKPQL